MDRSSKQKINKETSTCFQTQENEGKIVMFCVCK